MGYSKGWGKSRAWKASPCWIGFHPCWSLLCHHSENSEHHWRLLKSTCLPSNALQCQQQALGADKMFTYLEKKNAEKKCSSKIYFKTFLKISTVQSLLRSLIVALEGRPLFLIKFGVPSALWAKLPVHTLTQTANRLTETLKQGRELAACMLDSIIFCLLFLFKILRNTCAQASSVFSRSYKHQMLPPELKAPGVYLLHTATWW